MLQGAEEVQLQAWGGSTQEYLQIGLELSYIDPRVVVSFQQRRTPGTSREVFTYICIQMGPAPATFQGKALYGVLLSLLEQKTRLVSFVQVKVPLTEEGLEAANLLIRRGIRVTMTGVYYAHQVK